MNYRSPILSLQRDLETLEAELAALRALPPPQPRPAPVPSKKARATTQRETQLLRAKLKKIAKKIEARSVELGVRELTPREVAAGLMMQRIALGLVAAGALVLCVHLVIASRTRIVWTETTCTFVTDDEGDLMASYEVGKTSHTFFADRKDRPERVPCWVPAPSAIEHLGTLEKPTGPSVALRHKLSIGWILTSAIAVAFGIIGFAFNYLDERKRRNREIEPDVFGSDD